MNLKMNRKTKEKWNTLLFVFIILLKAANLAFQITEILPDVVEYLIETALIIAFIIAFIFNFVMNYRRFCLSVLLIGIVLSFMYFYAFINYPTIIEDVSKRFVLTILLGMPCMWSVINITDVGLFLKIIKPYSYCFTVLGTMIFLGDTGILSSNMTFSGMMLFPFCLHFYYASKNRFDLIIAVYEFLIIFIHGSRAGVVSILLFVFMYYFFKARYDFKAFKRFVICISLLLIVSLLFIYNLSELVAWTFENGIYIRNLDFIYAGEFADDNGRYDIQAEYIELILNSSPIRFVSVDLYDYGTAYPHNIFVEILYNYGYLLGGGLIIAFIYLLIKAILNCRYENFNLLMILTCSGFLPLLTSFTYFEWPLFWGLVGYLISLHNRRYKSGER